jgi:hypothetical protein
MHFTTAAAQSSTRPAPAPAVAEFDATHLTQPTDLNGIWLVHAGDDPAFARPDFDDSHWTPFDSKTSITTVFPNSHPEIVWYRTRVRVNPTQAGLGIMEQTISHAFELYVDGEPIMISGRIKPSIPYTMNAKLLAPIPDRMTASGTLAVALRVRISSTDWQGQDPGYFGANLTIGLESALYQQIWLSAIGENFFSAFDSFFLFSIGLVALVLFVSQRNQSEYLSIFGLGLVRILQFPFHAVSTFHNVPIAFQIVSTAVSIASPILWISIYFEIVRQRTSWSFRIFLILAGVGNAWSNLGGILPQPPGNYALLVNLPFILMLAVVLPILLIIHLRRGNREAGILLIPALLFSLFIYILYALNLLFAVPAWRPFALRGIAFITNYQAGPFTLSLNSISGILSTLSLAIIMLLRSTRMSRRQAILEGELAAAQQVQQVLLPAEIQTVPGFEIETAYQPAQQVGGDFFQIIPTPHNGLLLVVGDVAGKGLPAAMMVSLLVGAIRTAAEDTLAPELLLARLNERLVGRSSGGFSTALAAHIGADAKVTIANAGHLPPYLDGREIDLPGALPLGIVSGVRYEPQSFYLPPGSRLTFYSDGVIEAQSPTGELFGFDRGREISTESATAIVAAAQHFGQSDDITVVAITRTAVNAQAA